MAHDQAETDTPAGAPVLPPCRQHAQCQLPRFQGRDAALQETLWRCLQHNDILQSWCKSYFFITVTRCLICVLFYLYRIVTIAQCGTQCGTRILFHLYTYCLVAQFTCNCHLYTSLSMSSMYGASENCLKDLTNRMNARMILITLTRHPPKLFIPSLDSQSDR